MDSKGPDDPPADPGRRSRMPGFHRRTVEERRRALVAEGWLDAAEAEALAGAGGFTESVADAMSENVVGLHALPLALGLGFRVNGRELLAPMAVEEPSVVAAASGAARLVRDGGGFEAEADDPLMVAQIHLLGVPDFERARAALEGARDELLAAAARAVPDMVSRGGGPRELTVRLLEQAPGGAAVAVHVVVDVRDAMGANAVNTLAEALAPAVQARCGGRVALRILTNLADRRRVRVRARVPLSSLGRAGFPAAAERDGIADASRIAALDPYRACTHNKGIMNGVDAVLVATGNDWRAVEAGAHAWAARGGVYRPLSEWHADASGELAGSLELPLALGTVGGAARAHPGARRAIRLSGARDARELAMLAAAVGLAANLAALRALATEGIQRGHMALHARAVAAAAGAQGDEVERVGERLARERDFTAERARALLAELRAADRA